jgi:hypothetical protein
MVFYMNEQAECCKDSNNIEQVILPFIEGYESSNFHYITSTARNLLVCSVCGTVISPPDEFGRDIVAYRVMFSLN